jgi:cell division protein FtsQ
MRERRAQVLQDESRRRRKRWRWVVVPVVAVVAFVAVAHTPPLSVTDVRVEGAQETMDEAVLESAGIATGRPMLTLDEGSAERRVAELPWVGSVDVVRDWPGTVRIKLTERTPVAVAVADPSGPGALVDATGRVLRVGAIREGMVVLSGLEDLPDEGEELPVEAQDALAFAASAPERVPGVLGEISVDLEAVIAPGAPGAGASVSFRKGESVEERLVALDSVLTGAENVGCLATVDLWDPDHPVVTRRPGC